MDCSDGYTEAAGFSDDDRYARIRYAASEHLNLLTETQIREHDEEQTERRLVLMGVTGSCKSTVGNAVLGTEVFESRLSAKSITRKSQKHVQFRLGRNMTVIDTPGLNNTELTEKEIAIELANCIMMSSPGPHCFLLTIPIGPVSESFQKVLKFIKDIFGEEMFARTIAIFTKSDQLEQHKMPVEQFINEDQNLTVIVQRCADYMPFNCTRGVESQVEILLDKIDNLYLKHHESYYKKGFFSIPAQAKEEQENKRFRKKKEMVRKVLTTEPVYKQILEYENIIRRLETEHKQLKIQMNSYQENTKQLKFELEKCKKECSSLNQSIYQTNEIISQSDRRQTDALSRLTVETNDLKERVYNLRPLRVLPPRGLSRPRPYVTDLSQNNNF